MPPLLLWSTTALPTLQRFLSLTGGILFYLSHKQGSFVRGGGLCPQLCALPSTTTATIASLTSTQQNFGHLVEALYEAHCVSAQTANSAKVPFSHHVP